MAEPYASLTELKLALKIQPTDTTVDVLLNRALSSASKSIDRSTGRRFYLDADASPRTYSAANRLVCDEGQVRLIVDDIGSATGLTVEVGSDGTFGPLTDYETMPENALARERPITSISRPHWSLSPLSRVRVTARWGWPAVPDEIAQAALIQASRLYKRKDSPEGITGSADWGVIRLSRRDPDVYSLIEHFVLPGFG